MLKLNDPGRQGTRQAQFRSTLTDRKISKVDCCSVTIFNGRAKRVVPLEVRGKTSEQVLKELKAQFLNEKSFQNDRRLLGFACRPSNLKIDYFLTLQGESMEFLAGKAIQLQPFFGQPKRRQVNMQNFKMLRCIGAGGFAKVFLVRSRLDGNFYAMKLIEKHILAQNRRQVIVQNERDIMVQTSHPFLMRLQYAFESKDYIVFVMEFCPGGELFSYIKKWKRMDEDMAKFYLLEILLGIENLHANNIVYRDIKPENILIDLEGHVRVSDFGLSKPGMSDRDQAYSFCGSPEYMSPQMILKAGHNFTVDYYCIGALLYEMLTGLPPFYSRNTQEIYESIIAEQLTFPKNNLISNQAKSLMRALLNKNPKLRLGSMLGVKEILAHPWFGKIKRDDILKKKLIPPIKINCSENLKFDFSSHREAELQVRQTLESQLLPENQKFKRLFTDAFYYEAGPGQDSLPLKFSKSQEVTRAASSQRLLMR